MYKLIFISSNDSKTICLTIIFFFYILTDIYSQNNVIPLKIEIEDFIEDRPSISNLLEQQIGMYVPSYVYNSINTKSIVVVTFSVDSLYRVNSIFSDNTPPLLKNEITVIFKRWSELRTLINDVKEKNIALNKKYIIPIIFHFRYTSLDESTHTFNTDYVVVNNFLKSMDWNNAEMMDFIMIDLRCKKL